MSNYVADVSVQDAYAALTADQNAALVDVRTAAEWDYVGTPDLDALRKPVHLIEWVTYPNNQPNDAFLSQLEEAGIAKDAPVYFLCRSGARSAAAASAAAQAGFSATYNILQGFEGDLDEAGHRSVAGWRNSGLPWRQS